MTPTFSGNRAQKSVMVRNMEDVLQVYKRPYDPLRPIVRMDETSKQLIGETRLPVDAAPGQPRRVDDEYEHKGVADLFMFFEPLRGWASRPFRSATALPIIAIAESLWKQRRGRW
jgi:hypothetical protein